MSTVATATRKLLMSRVEDAAGLHSDLYKDVYGVRPRFQWMREGDSLVSVLRRIESSIAALSADLREQLARERAEREAFNAKVSALGLDPAKYARLFEDYCDE